MASINVYVRMRPFLNGEREEAEKSQRITLAHDCKQVKYHCGHVEPS